MEKMNNLRAKLNNDEKMDVILYAAAVWTEERPGQCQPWLRSMLSDCLDDSDVDVAMDAIQGMDATELQNYRRHLNVIRPSAAVAPPVPNITQHQSEDISSLTSPSVDAFPAKIADGVIYGLGHIQENPRSHDSPSDTNATKGTDETPHI